MNAVVSGESLLTSAATDLNCGGSAFTLRAMLSVRVALAKGFLFFCLVGFGAGASAGELLTPTSFASPKVAEASNEGEMAMKGFVLPEGFKVELIAAEPHLANPVAFDIDHAGRIWVAETFRLHAGVTDIRGKNS